MESCRIYDVRAVHTCMLKSLILNSRTIVRLYMFGVVIKYKALSFIFVIFCFFFQAEDGIRDLVRSRGLGDVYKRQGQNEHIMDFIMTGADCSFYFAGISKSGVECTVRVHAKHSKIVVIVTRFNSTCGYDFAIRLNCNGVGSVSYTHLTLPTSDLV
mgnify:CR=1 FL=1